MAPVPESIEEVAVFLALMGFFLQPIGGDLVVVSEDFFYEVAGSQAEELRESMKLLGPKDENGERHNGFTDWSVRWNYKFRAVAGVCYLTSFTTSLTVDTTLPQWDKRGATPALRDRWDAYLLALKDHETEHASIARRAARRIQEGGAALWSALSCPVLAAAIKSSSEALLARHRKEDVEYRRSEPAFALSSEPEPDSERRQEREGS